ncbi:hypothetical protein PENSPDRAFT_749292 [Peniophora sp. CONT]|nr:hypothetical protein PENSPDRAFT_749292 [Peniophora sp. CONT]
MEGEWFGPVPVDKWIEDLVQKPKKTASSEPKSAPFMSVASTAIETADFVAAINFSLGDVLHGHGVFCKDTHKFFGCSGTSDLNDLLKDLPAVSFLGKDTCEVSRDDDGLQRLLGEILFFGDVKRTNSQDPCMHITTAEDREKLGQLESEVDVDELLDIRCQFMDYAHGVSVNGHRTFLYGFVVLPTHARLLHFDHSGVAYSELFDWRATSYLTLFFQRFAFASATGRGIDTSATRVAHDDNLVEDAKTIFKQAKKEDLLPDDVTWHSVFPPNHPKLNNHPTYWMFNVYDKPSNSFHRVLAYRPNKSHPYFFGRATCGYIAVDLTERAVVYMKRSWRISGGIKERDLYLELEKVVNGETVPHLPGCYFGGDVPAASGRVAAKYFKWKSTAAPGDAWSQTKYGKRSIRTFTSDYARRYPDIRRGGANVTEAKDADSRATQHVLTVTVFRRVGGSLSKFRNSRQLCIALRDAVEGDSELLPFNHTMKINTNVSLAHEAAYRLKNILHRDISNGNILIAKVPGKKGEVEGLLIDWDLCINIVEHEIEYRKHRVGTRPFMSVRMLQRPEDFVHEVRDDLESFCHVLHHQVFHYLHTVLPDDKGSLLSELQSAFAPREIMHGDNYRSLYVCNKSPYLDLAAYEIAPKALSKTMARVRWLFAPLCARKPREPPTDRARYCHAEHEHYKWELRVYEDEVVRATQYLSHQTLLKSFNDHLADDTLWSPNDSAQEQYPLHVRQVHREGGSIKGYYKPTERGVIVLTQSEYELEMARKRKIEDLGYDDCDTAVSVSGGTTQDSQATEVTQCKRPRLGSNA